MIKKLLFVLLILNLLSLNMHAVTAPEKIKLEQMTQSL